MCFQTRVPLAIAGVTLTLIAFHMAWPVSSHLLYALGVAGVIVTAFRIGSEIIYHRRKTRGALLMREAERWERLYACSSFIFAGLIGSLGALAFRDDNPPDHLLVTHLFSAMRQALSAAFRFAQPLRSRLYYWLRCRRRCLPFRASREASHSTRSSWWRFCSGALRPFVFSTARMFNRSLSSISSQRSL